MDKKGLSDKEAGKLLEQYGTNEIVESGVKSPLKILFHQIKGNLVIYLLIFTVIISFLINKNVTAYVIIGVILLVVGSGFFQEYKAEKAISALKKMLISVSIVIRNGKEQEILSKNIVPGDIIVLRNGEKIPADCIVIEEKDILVNEAVLTGESKEIRKFVATDKKYADKNMLFMGTFLVNGRAIAKVVHTGMNTKFGKIAGMISTAEKELPLQKKVNDISRFMIFVAIGFALLTGIFMVLENPFSQNLLFDALILTIALAVSAFPEGFPVVLTTALSVGAYRMAKNNAIVNRMSIIETLGETTIICADKTGTLTKGEMTIKKIYADNKLIEVSGVGYEGEGEFKVDGEKIDPKKDKTLDLLIKCGVLCNDSIIERTGEDHEFHILGSPTEASLLIMAAKAGVYKEDIKATRVEEIQFNSERKMMSVLSKYDHSNYVFSKGALEFLLKKCKSIQRSDGVFTLTQREKEKILALNKKMASSSYRTLALAYKKVSTFSKDHFEEDLIFLGLVSMEDPPRKEVRDAIRVCLHAGINVKMITGDNMDTALSVARQIGIRGESLSGEDLDKISEEELSKILPKISIFARVKPEHKLKIVKALKINGEIVTMTGDGVNDAPALKEAHIGVAMGKSGTDVSRSVADLTLKDDNFATIVQAIKEGRTIFKNIRKFVSYQLSCNYAELMILFVGVILSPFLGWQIPILLAIQILFMNLVTDDLPAITIALTPQSRDVMEESPRKNAEILNGSLILWFVIAGFAMGILTLIVFFITHNIFNFDFVHARTTALVTLILLEIANAYNFLSFRQKASHKLLFINKYLTYASIISIVATLIIIYTPANIIFGTTPIEWKEWAIALGSSILIVLLFNLLKTINHRTHFFKLEQFSNV